MRDIGEAVPIMGRSRVSRLSLQLADRDFGDDGRIELGAEGERVCVLRVSMRSGVRYLESVSDRLMAFASMGFVSVMMSADVRGVAIE